MARERSGRTAQHLVLAARLRALREGAGLSVAQAAAALGAHPATVRRIEQAQTSLDAGQVACLLEAYGAGRGERDDVMDRLATANLPGWWHPWRDAMDPWQQDLMSVESAAGIVRVWDPVLVPLLLRTPAYAQAVDAALRPGLSAAVRVRRAEFLAERQRQLRVQQTRLWALLPESALHAGVGGPDVLREQIGVLCEQALLPDITVQTHRRAGPLHPLTGVGALHMYRVEVPGIADHVVREGALPGAADVGDDRRTVTAYRQALDVSCVMALGPAPTREVLEGLRDDN